MKTEKTKKTLAVITLILSVVFFGLGVSFPLFSTETGVSIPRFVAWIPFVPERIVLSYDTVNLFDSIKWFFDNGGCLLGAVILVFSFLFPVFGYVGLIIRLFTNKTSETLQNLDKWNMLDVFLVALLILNFQMGADFVIMELKMGTTFIALAVLFRILTIVLITKRRVF